MNNSHGGSALCTWTVQQGAARLFEASSAVNKLPIDSQSAWRHHGHLRFSSCPTLIILLSVSSVQPHKRGKHAGASARTKHKLQKGGGNVLSYYMFLPYPATVQHPLIHTLLKSGPVSASLIEALSTQRDCAKE